ncbi:hypothetical protein QQZ08_005412 [Neonectria magnoliae]|uniref:Alcohol dehydrogenase-like N-terminal domain-containing protein n=1 Tax=Neonectria magnoliae TaxID=2732573 RepID=A0ABR1I569_9HYPO
MQSLKSVERHKAGIVEGALPTLRHGKVLVKTKPVALNPSDWKSINWLATLGSTIRCDYAGIFEEVGEGVEKAWKKGDRIAGMANGNNPLRPDGGTFTQYIVVKGDVQIKIPDNVDFEEAVTLGIGTATVGQDRVFDYNLPTCGADIQELTKNRLFHAWDYFAEDSSPKVCTDALSTEKIPSGEQPIHGSLFPQGAGRDDVTSFTSMAHTIFAEPLERGPYSMPASQEGFEFANKFISVTEWLLADVKLVYQVE